jgi:3'(2'), 5'-bisphosphate nucleotidase
MIHHQINNTNTYINVGQNTLISNICKIAGIKYTVLINTDKFKQFLNGVNIDTLLPEYSIYDRVFIKTGLTPKEQVYHAENKINWENSPYLLRQNLLEIAIRSVKDASKYIMDIYNSNNLNVQYKSKNQPVTKADLGSHKHITGYLKAHTPYYVLSEESGESYFKNIEQHEAFWLIDPLDGTKEFINKNGEFGILISFIHKGESILGVIYFPVTDEIYFASKGHHAWKIKNFIKIIDKYDISKAINRRIELNLNNVFPESCNLNLISSRSHKTNELNNFIDGLKRYGYSITEKTCGACVKFAKILNNEADVYARICLNGNGPSQWDIAAADCIIKEAGGEVLNLYSRKNLKYGIADMKLPSFIIKHSDLDI